MAADYDKLFRPHEGMEAPDDMAAQPFFDPSASFPPAPASANLPKPNGQTPPPTSDDLSERFVSAPPPPPPPPPPPTPMPIAAGEPPSPEPAASKPPTPPMPIAGPEPAPPKPPTPPCPSPDPNRPHPNHPHLRCPSPDLHPPQPNPSWRPPDHRHHKRQPERRSNRNHRRPTYPRTGHINPGAPHQHRPGQRCQPPPAPSRPSASPAEPPTRPAPQHSRRARRGHRYRTDTERNVGKVATGPSIQARLRAEEASGAQLAPGTEPSPAPLGQPRSYLAPPTRPAPTEPPPSPSPQRNSGRRAERRVHPDLAAQHAAAQPDSITAATTGGRRRKRAAPDLDATQKSLRPAAKGPKVKKVKPQKPKATKPPKVVSQRGWRHWVHALTRINLGLSPDEKYELDLHARVRRNPRGSYQIAVVGLKGGAGKTTLTAALGSTLAQVRADRILALDADPGAGNLADRVGRQSGATIADVLAEKELSHYNDIRAHTSVNAVNLEVLPAPEYSSAQRALSDADWHFIADPASRFYNLVLADCGAGFFDPLTRGVLSTVSGVVVVASVSIDGAQQASVALDWLRNNGYQDLASRACVVINHIMPGEPNVAVKDLVRHFEQQVQPGRVVVMPWDRHIAAGTEISLDLLDPIYKRKVLELAAALSDDFERAGRR
ncbi:ESX-1 secretion-associated protein EspI [Mycobacterium tuberculosis variant africanum MAL010123]|nr:ESX-1 secretion-associated protein EspI [Mycobacterium tuberculosis variant africanum MAL010123]